MRDKHHLFWPRRNYKGKYERRFRNLPCNVVLLDEQIHSLLHTLQRPPGKPTHNEMLEAIHRHENQLCGCYFQRDEGKHPRGR